MGQRGRGHADDSIDTDKLRNIRRSFQDNSSVHTMRSATVGRGNDPSAVPQTAYSSYRSYRPYKRLKTNSSDFSHSTSADQFTEDTKSVATWTMDGDSCPSTLQDPRTDMSGSCQRASHGMTLNTQPDAHDAVTRVRTDNQVSFHTNHSGGGDFESASAILVPEVATPLPSSQTSACPDPDDVILVDRSVSHHRRQVVSVPIVDHEADGKDEETFRPRADASWLERVMHLVSQGTRGEHDYGWVMRAPQGGTVLHGVLQYQSS